MRKSLLILFVLGLFLAGGLFSVQAQDCATDPDSCYDSAEAISTVNYQWDNGESKDITQDNTLYYDNDSLYVDNDRNNKICERIDQETNREFSGTKTYTGVQSCQNYKVSLTVPGTFLSQIASTSKIKAKLNVDGLCDGTGTFTEEKTVGATTSDLQLETAVISHSCKPQIFGGTAGVNISIFINNKEITPAVVYQFVNKPVSTTTQCQIDFTNLTQGGSTKCVNPQSHCIEFLGASIDDTVRIEVAGIDSLGYETKLISNNDTLATYVETETSALLDQNFLSAGNYVIKLVLPTADIQTILCQRTLNVTNRGEDLIPPGSNLTQDELTEFALNVAETIPLCESISDSGLRNKCEACAGSGEVNRGIWTGIGCMPTNFGGIISTLFTTFSGLLGGLIFLCLVANGLKIMSSRGNPEAMKKGQEAITSCVVGFVVLILSILFLKIVGVDILQLPGWN